MPAIILLVFWAAGLTRSLRPWRFGGGGGVQHLKRPWRSERDGAVRRLRRRHDAFAHGEGGAATVCFAAAAGVSVAAVVSHRGARRARDGRARVVGALCLIYVGMLGSAIVPLRGLDRARLDVPGTLRHLRDRYDGLHCRPRDRPPQAGAEDQPRRRGRILRRLAGGAAMVLIANSCSV
jgi:hypothetical protein